MKICPWVLKLSATKFNLSFNFIFISLKKYLLAYIYEHIMTYSSNACQKSPVRTVIFVRYFSAVFLNLPMQLFNFMFPKCRFQMITILKKLSKMSHPDCLTFYSAKYYLSLELIHPTIGFTMVGCLPFLILVIVQLKLAHFVYQFKEIFIIPLHVFSISPCILQGEASFSSICFDFKLFIFMFKRNAYVFSWVEPKVLYFSREIYLFEMRRAVVQEQKEILSICSCILQMRTYSVAWIKRPAGTPCLPPTCCLRVCVSARSLANTGTGAKSDLAKIKAFHTAS